MLPLTKKELKLHRAKFTPRCDSMLHLWKKIPKQVC